MSIKWVVEIRAIIVRRLLLDLEVIVIGRDRRDGLIL